MAIVNLMSLDVDALFQQIKVTTGLFRVWKVSGDDIVTQCPFHGGGQERNPSFGICNNRANPQYGKYHCFACGAKGSIIDLINRLNNKSIDDTYGIEVAQSVGSVEITDERNQIRILPRNEQKVVESVSPYELAYYRETHSDYLTGRHILPVIQDAFDCGYDPENQSVTFPVRRIDGSTSFIVRRAVNLKWYHYPAGVKKPVYGIYELSRLLPNTKSVIIVESIINALTLWGMQLPAVALLGTGSREQIEYLNSTDIRNWILALDGDVAGRTATHKLQSRLLAHTTVMPIPSGYDVNDLDSATLQILYALRR